MVSRSVVGFGRGFAAPFGALVGLLRQPRAWPFAAVPAFVFVLLEVVFVVGSWQFLTPWVMTTGQALVERLAPTLDREASGEGWASDLGFTALRWLAELLLAALGWIFAALLSPVISSPALERIVGIVELELSAPLRPQLGFFAELWCGLRAMFVSLIVTLMLVAGLTLLELVAPPLSVVTMPLKLLLGALGVAWGLFDYPLTLRGVGSLQRFAFVRRHFSAVLGFGVAFSLVFWLPCFGILMLPVGVAAATRLYWQIERSEP